MTSTNYSATFASIESIRKHSNADRLMVATVAGGYQVIVGTDHKVGDWGIYFPVGCEINYHFALGMKLFKKHPETQEVLGGYLDNPARIYCLRLRGESSQGLWLSMDSIDKVFNTGFKPVEGSVVPEFNWSGDRGDEPGFLAWRYLTPQARRAEAKAFSSSNSKKKNFFERIKEYFFPEVTVLWSPAYPLEEKFPEVGDTPRLFENMKSVQFPVEVSITEKLHGTSGRTGSILVKRELTYFEWLLFSFYIWFASNISFDFAWKHIYPYVVWPVSYKTVTGTRRTVHLDNKKYRRPISSKEEYRKIISDELSKYIEHGEVWYYEIVGRHMSNNGGNKPIMATHSLQKDMKDLYMQAAHNSGVFPDEVPKTVVYERTSPIPGNPYPFEIYVYRVLSQGSVLTGEDLQTFLRNRLKNSQDHWIMPIPLLRNFVAKDLDQLKLAVSGELNKLMLDGASLAPREGVCVNFHRANSLAEDEENNSDFIYSSTFKHKGQLFSELEGIKHRELEVSGDSEELNEDDI